MNRPHLTVGSLMATVLYFAIGFAALRSGSVWWGVGLATTAILVVAMATLLAIANRGRARLIRAGFAIFGWAYLLLGFPTGLDDASPRPLAVTMAPFDLLYPYLMPEAPPTQPMSARLPYLWASHGILAMSFGLVGGLMGYIIGDHDDELTRGG